MERKEGSISMPATTALGRETSMDILRIDHLHIKGFEYEGFKGAFEQLMGKEFYMDME